jgi:general secretion pathway protein C
VQAFLKKNFWVVNLLTALVCAVFAGKAITHWVEGKWLGDDPEPAKPRRVAQKPAKPKVTRSKAGQALADRNMFCSACLPPEPVADVGPIDDSAGPPMTSLPLKLIATNVANAEASSFATIHNTSSQRVGAYRIGEEIPDAGAVVRIRGRYVDFENKSSRRVERIAFGMVGEPRPRPTAAAEPEPTGEPKDDVTAALDEGIKKIDDTHYEVDRALVEKIIANPTAIRGARIVPSIKNGKPNGFKLYAIRPSSAFAKIGLQNGDTIHAINGYDLTSPDKALEVYTKVREANSLSVSVTRRGKSMNMEYTIQ